MELFSTVRLLAYIVQTGALLSLPTSISAWVDMDEMRNKMLKS